MNIYKTLNHQPFMLRNYCLFSKEREIFDIGKLRENKKIADETIQYVRSKITKVATRGIKPPHTEEKLFELYEINDKLAKARDLREKIYFSHTKRFFWSKY